MDESAKELLKHLTGLIDESAKKVTSQLSVRSEAIEKSVATLSTEFNAWRPRLEARVDELQSVVTALQRTTGSRPIGATTVPVGEDPTATNHAGGQGLGMPSTTHLADGHGLGMPPLVGPRPATSDLGLGHGESMLHRGAALAATVSSTPPPVTATTPHRSIPGSWCPGLTRPAAALPLSRPSHQVMGNDRGHGVYDKSSSTDEAITTSTHTTTLVMASPAFNADDCWYIVRSMPTSLSGGRCVVPRPEVRDRVGEAAYKVGGGQEGVC